MRTFFQAVGGMITVLIVFAVGLFSRPHVFCDDNAPAPRETVVVHESRQEYLRPEHLDTGAPGATSVAPQHYVTTEMTTYDAQSTIQSDWKFVDPYAGVSGTFSIHPNAPLPVLVGARETLPDGSKIVVLRGYAHQEQSRVGLFGEGKKDEGAAAKPEQAAEPATPATPVQPTPPAPLPEQQLDVQTAPPVQAKAEEKPAAAKPATTPTPTKKAPPARRPVSEGPAQKTAANIAAK